jgi:hypothetical protein
MQLAIGIPVRTAKALIAAAIALTGVDWSRTDAAYYADPAIKAQTQTLRRIAYNDV